MSVYQQSKVKLHQALSMDIEQSSRIWFIPGLHVNLEGLPKNATRIKTMVIKSSSSKFAVAVELVAKKEAKPDDKKVGEFLLPLNEAPKAYIKIVAKFSSLEELKEEFPQLFELEGFLFAF